jgi:hypothetical protein
LQAFGGLDKRASGVYSARRIVTMKTAARSENGYEG